MPKKSLFLYALALAVSPAMIAAMPSAAVAQAAHYSTSTTQLGVLLADPAAKAVLMKHIPQLLAGPDLADKASGMTLHEVSDSLKAFSPDILSAKVLDAIDVDLAKLPVKN